MPFQIFFLRIISFSVFVFMPFAIADVPVISSSENYDSGSLSMEQRTQRLEQQIANLNSAGVLSQVDELRHELQSLHGQIEVQTHDLKLLSNQMKSFYNDLDNRLAEFSQTQQKGFFNINKTKQDEEKQTTAASSKEDLTYSEAYQLIDQQQYEKAVKGLRNYVKSFPEGRNLPLAHYWLGELYVILNKPKQAVVEFSMLTKDFPDHPKVPDAMLKLGNLYAEQGDQQMASKYLVQLQKRFPEASSTRLAEAKLKEMAGN